MAGVHFRVGLFLAIVVGLLAANADLIAAPPVKLTEAENVALALLDKRGASWTQNKSSSNVSVFLDRVQIDDEVWQQLYVLADKLDYLTGLAANQPFTDDDLPRLLKLPQLRLIDLNYAKISDGGLAKLKPLNKLEEIYLRQAPITGEGLVYLNALPNLKVLYLYESAVGDEGLRVIGTMHGLEQLFLSYTKVTDVGVAHLKDLTKLKRLLLTHTRVGDPGMETIAKLTSLEEIDVTGTQVTDAGVGQLAELARLRILDVAATETTDAMIPTLLKLKKLEQLNVSKTQVTDEGLAVIKKAFPKLKLIALSRGAPPASKIEWTVFEAKEQGFLCAFPAGAKVKEQQVLGGAAKWQFEATSDNHRFSVTVMPTPFESSPDRKVLEAFLAKVSVAYAKQVNGKITVGKDREVGPYRGWQFHYTSPSNDSVYCRLAVVDRHKMYELMIQSPSNKTLTPGDVEAFFQAFRIVATPQNTVKLAADRAELVGFQGDWEATSYALNGVEPKKGTHRVSFKGDIMTHRIFEGDKLVQGVMFRIELNPSTNPKQFTYHVKDGPAVIRGIYALEQQTLRLCAVPINEPIPNEFRTVKGDNRQLIHLRHVLPRATLQALDASSAGWLGTICRPTNLGDMREAKLQTLQGVYVVYSPKFGPAHAAGIRPGDILLSIHQNPVTSFDVYKQLLSAFPPGKKISLRFGRHSLQRTIEVTLADPMPDAELLQKSLAEAEAGEAAAQLFMGFSYAAGKGTTKSPMMAAAWYQRSAKKGNRSAQGRLGSMYLNGHGIAQDDAQAFHWFRAAASAGDLAAQTNLGLMYASGRATTQDYQEAIYWYRRASEGGSTQAQCNLATLYYNGTGVPQDYQQAARWLKMAVQQDSPRALSMLGWMYHMGEGVGQSDAKGVPMIRKAAELGFAQAQGNLGVLYHSGNGLPLNYEESLKWFRKAAEQGNSYAMNNLGLAYARGQGVAPNHQIAISWFRKAANQGLDDAVNNLRAMGVR